PGLGAVVDPGEGIAAGEAPPDQPAFDSWMPIVPVEGEEEAEADVLIGGDPPASPEQRAPATTVRKPTPLRRGPAPVYEGRAAVVPDGASVEWVSGPAIEDEPAPVPQPAQPAQPEAHADRRPKGPPPVARTLPSMGLAPLPRTPPPNATAWTSFPSPPP